uniref:Uncharacterized protein n=1 Tax=Rhizophora mucronata TaxID=61149 RepID=A0A2P2PBS2_RHIMU
MENVQNFCSCLMSLSYDKEKGEL